MVTEEQAHDVLLTQVAKECKVPMDVLLRLAALEQMIPDVNIHGAKAELGRHVAAIIDEAATREGND